jgi:hypothetical protein
MCLEGCLLCQLLLPTLALASQRSPFGMALVASNVVCLSTGMSVLVSVWGALLGRSSTRT